MRLSTTILIVLLSLAVVYFGYEIVFVLPNVLGFGIWSSFLSITLLIAEILAAIFGIYIYYSIFCAAEWKSPKYKNFKHSFVTIIIPCFNEPFKVVRKTLLACLAQDYPKDKYEIIVADDSTENSKREKLERFCKKNGIKFIHRSHRTGFKAGALNNATRFAKGDFIAILDADDIPEPNFLSHCMTTILSNDRLAFVQTRNCERNFEQNVITKISGSIRNVFFSSVMKGKDNRQLALFCGSGGVVRRKALEELGGWPEETLTEDTDFTTKVFAAGWTSAYINPAECHGLLPQSYSAFQAQTFRWAKGVTQTLFLRWRLILKIPKITRKIEHLLSCMSYLIGPIVLAISTVLTIHLLAGIPIFHQYDPTFLWVFGIFLAFSSFFAILHTQISEKKFSPSQIAIYLLASSCICVNFTKAVFSALLKRKKTFCRTVKIKGRKSPIIVRLKKCWLEILLGSISIYAALITIFNPVYTVQAFWALFFGIGFLSGPIFSLKYG